MQWSGFLVSAHDFWFAGASPKYSAICAFTSGETTWFSHRYEQLMFAVSFLIIQVSDQPVAPSVGLVVATDVPDVGVGEVRGELPALRLGHRAARPGPGPA